MCLQICLETIPIIGLSETLQNITVKKCIKFRAVRINGAKNEVTEYTKEPKK
jgi:hypothetical protein